MTEQPTDEAALEMAELIAYQNYLGFPHAPHKNLVWRALQRGALAAIRALPIAPPVPAVDDTADEGPTRVEWLEMDLAQTNALVDQQADRLSRLQGHFASMIIDPDVCAVAKDIARAALNHEGNVG